MKGLSPENPLVRTKDEATLNIQELNELIRLHGAAVYSFCCRLAANRPDAEDLYQETFLKATELCRKIDRYDNPKAFLLAIALRLWKDKRRKFARRQRIAPMESLPEDGLFRIKTAVLG